MPEKVFSIRNLIIVVAVTRKSRGDSEWLCALLLLLLFLKDAKVYRRLDGGELRSELLTQWKTCRLFSNDTFARAAEWWTGNSGDSASRGNAGFPGTARRACYKRVRVFR